MANQVLSLSGFLKQKDKVLEEQVIVILNDKSGSAKGHIDEKIKTESMNIICEYPNNKWYVIFFSETSSKIYEIIIIAGNIINYPEQEPEGRTFTHLGFKKCFEIPNLNIIILNTDGQTSSSLKEIEDEKNVCEKRNIAIFCNSIMNSKDDFNKLSINEKSIPGMELIDMIKNGITKLKVYNDHQDSPFTLIESSYIDKKNINFMGFIEKPKNEPISIFITNIIKSISNQQINWGHKNNDFCKFIMEIGKLLSLIFMDFPENNFIDTIIAELNKIVAGIDIKTIIKYGFECTKKKEPMRQINIEEIASKNAVERRGEFYDANKKLLAFGSTCNDSNTVGIGKYITVINKCNTITPSKPFGEYKESKDDYGFLYLSTKQENGQSTRQIMRKWCSENNYKDAIKSPIVIFHTACLMGKLWITSGIKPHNELVKLAIIQLSMNIIIGKDKYNKFMYSAKSLYDMWSEGELPPIFYNETKTHASLYEYEIINPFGMPQPEWWAFMMALIGLYDKQFKHYKYEIEGLKLKENGFGEGANGFLDYIFKTYKVNEEQNIYKIVELNPQPTSVFTLEPFNKEEKVYQLQDHEQCKSKTIVSESEKNYIKQNKCVWCKKENIGEEYFIQYVLPEDPNAILKRIIQGNKI